jgi:nucleotide-binding universal stress UspA family protein
MEGSDHVEWAWSNSPIILPVSYESREWNAVYVAFYIAEYSGSKLFITHVHDGAEQHPFQEEFNRDVEELARELDVKYEYVMVEPNTTPPAVEEIARGIVGTAQKTGAQAIVMSAHRETFFRELLGRVSDHVARTSNTRVILVETPKPGVRIPKNPKRILIPVLKRMNTDPFVVSAALTSSASAPDVEIFVAKVIQLPSTVPLDAVDVADVLKREEKDFSYFAAEAIKSLGRTFSPRVLPVREIGEGVHQFVKEKGVDVMVMLSDRKTGFSGFFTKDEYEIVKDAPCVVLVTLPGTDAPRKGQFGRA